jgi:uncharacterized DUF497 family protein
MLLSFEWDDAKARENLRKHRVGFEEATEIFRDPLSITVPDPSHSLHESRFTILGLTQRDRALVVVYTERGETIRIVSCRQATPHERKRYEKQE